MDNVITILVDSVFSECIGNGRTEISSTPFIDKMISEGFFSPNVYSYGPYTDAATKGLYCGAPSLKHYGYYYGLNSSDDYHFRTFHDNGYETYGFYYPYYLIGSKVRKYIDHTCYSGCFDYPAIWMGKYEFYANRKKAGELTELEYKILIKYTELLFDCWLSFYHKARNDKDSLAIINNAKGDKTDSEELLKGEFNKYKEDKKAYVDQILEDGENHIFSTINNYVYDNAIDVDWIVKNVYGKYRKFFNQVDSIEFWKNIQNNRFDIKKCLTNRRYLQNTAICLFSGKYNKYVSKKTGWQLHSSMFKKVDTVVKILKERDNSKPFYFSLHTEEPHNYVAWFSYDITDHEVIDEEINYLQPLLDHCGKHFKGNITYQLSLRYVDLCVKRLVESLKELNLLENTTILLMSDHGTSYSYYPVRDSVVNNFYKENYKTPMLIWSGNNKNKPKGKFTGLYSAADVQTTLCKYLGIKKPDDYCGTPIMDLPEGRPFVITEYMGPGCPDMLNREIWMSIRNEKFCLAYKMKINSNFDIDNPAEIYDLINDPQELLNLRDSVSVSQDSDLNTLALHIKQRFEDIQEETSQFLNDFDSWNVILPMTE